MCTLRAVEEQLFVAVGFGGSLDVQAGRPHMEQGGPGDRVGREGRQ